MMMIVDSDNLPLNFFGGFDKSPASGHTTHLSSTNLKKKMIKIIRNIRNRYKLISISSFTK